MTKTKKQSEPRPFSERANSKIIDRAAGRILKSILPDAWVENELPDDHAKDHHIELTIPITWGKGRNRRKTEKVTGRVFYVQRKGVEKAKLITSRTLVAFKGLELKDLTYWADECPLPMFLVVVDKTAEKCYYLFMQKVPERKPGMA